MSDRCSTGLPPLDTRGLDVNDELLRSDPCWIVESTGGERGCEEGFRRKLMLLLVLLLLEVIEIGGDAREGIALRGGFGEGPDEMEVVETVLKAEPLSVAVKAW